MLNKMSNNTFLGYALEGPGEEEKLWKGETLTGRGGEQIVVYNSVHSELL